MKTDFENWKMLFEFNHPDENLKSWIDENNYTNTYKEDWEKLMSIVDELEGQDIDGHYYTVHISTEKTEIKNDMFLVVFENEGLSRVENTYNAILQFVEFYNNEKN